MTKTAQLPTTDAGRQYHLGVGPDEVAQHVLLVGDPERARRVAARFESVELERVNREFITITGRLGGRRRPLREREDLIYRVTRLRCNCM